MYVPDRLTRILYIAGEDVVVAPDVRGRLHKFDAELNLLHSSPTTSYHRPINAITADDRFIFTKDRTGAIAKWDLATLAPLDVYDEVMLRDEQCLMEDEEPSPSPCRGITVLNGKLYVNNGYGQLCVIDTESFDVVEIRQSPSPTFFDTFNVELPDLHGAADVTGTVYIGNLETNEFPTRIKIDENVVHGLCYDKRHHRFWATQDGGRNPDLGTTVMPGMCTFELDGSNLQEFKISHEDHEFMQFNPDCTKMYVGGFNGNIYVFDNTEKEISLQRVIGPMPFQITHGVVVNDDQIYVLLQTGEVYRLNEQGRVVNRVDFANRCAWIMEPHPQDESLLYIGTDQGVELLRYGAGHYGTVKLERVAQHSHGFGITKDVKPLPDGSYVAIGRSGWAFRANERGNLLWHVPVTGYPRGIGVSEDFTKCLVGSDDGSVLELSMEDGRVLDRIEMSSAVYCVGYTPDGRRIMSTDTDTKVHVLAAESQEKVGEIELRVRLKRLIKKDGKIFTIGGDGLCELDLENYAVKRQFNELVANTKESGTVLDGVAYIGGYGYAIGAYDYETGEIIGLLENQQDFTKSFAGRIGEDGVPILLVGGRTGFINAYRVVDRELRKVREIYLR